MINFNTQKEVDQYFKNTTFKFEYISDGIAFFKTLNPINVDDCYVDFALSFYAGEDAEFFCYVPYENFSRMQLSEVRLFIAHSEETEQLFFRQYNQHELN